MVWKFKLDHIFLAALSFKVKSFSAMIKDLAKKRTELGCNIEQKDCFYYMLNAKDPKTGKGLSNKELWCESLQLIIAGMILYIFRFACRDTQNELRLGYDWYGT